MKIKYQAEKLKRINHGFMGFKCLERGWWHNHDLNRWEENPKHGEYNYGTHKPCNSVKAFRRLLKKAPKGLKFMLINRYKYSHVYGFGTLNK